MEFPDLKWNQLQLHMYIHHLVLNLSWEANFFISDIVNAIKFVCLHDKRSIKLK